MRVEKEFTVGAPLQRTWRTVSDLGVLAGCIPGADMKPADDMYAGRLALGSNGSAGEWYASLRAVDADDDDNVVTVLLQGRQANGTAIGTARVTSRCTAEGQGTSVSLSAELVSSGYSMAQEDLNRAAGQLLDEAARRLEQRATAEPAQPPRPPQVPRPGSDAITAPTGTGLGGARQRLALAGGALLAIAILRRLLGGRRGQRG